MSAIQSSPLSAGVVDDVGITATEAATTTATKTTKTTGTAPAKGIPISASTTEKEKEHSDSVVPSSSIIRDLVLGFDVEWKPAITKEEYYRVSLVQLSTLSSVLLIQLRNDSEAIGILKPLRELINNRNIRKVGVGVLCDLKKLEVDYGKNV